MGRRNRQDELHNHNVEPLNNDYVRSNPQAKAQIKAKRAVLRRRRMAVFFIFAVVIIGALVQANMGKNEQLAEKKEQKAAVTESLNASLEAQEMLNLQIAKLEDDEYIAKLARKEFFLSEEGEIIFTMPKTSEKDEEQESTEHE